MKNPIFYAAILAFSLTACGSPQYEHKVSGGTQNKVDVTFAETFCDKETFPDVFKRQECKLKFLDALACREGTSTATSTSAQ